MANPLNNGKGNMPRINESDPFNQMEKFLEGGGTPEQFVTNMVTNNPRMQQAMQYMQNVSTKQNPKDIAMQLAKQRGIPQERLMKFAKRLGLK